MTILLKNKFQVIKHDEKSNLIEFSWKENISHKLNDKLFFQEVKIGADLISKYLPKKIIVQTQNLEYPISPKLQIQINKILYKSYEEAVISKLAFVMPEDIVEQMSIEQTVQVSETKNFFKTEYFKNLTDAYAWINQ
ncbi:MAG: hypothetical protein JXL97_16780 [Bacteroidales bacterium]|nr:hypothetical protein [Bacteroidales bacterium]